MKLHTFTAHRTTAKSKCHRYVIGYADTQLPHQKKVLTSGLGVGISIGCSYRTKSDSTNRSFHSNYATVHNKFQQPHKKQYTRMEQSTDFRGSQNLTTTKNKNKCVSQILGEYLPCREFDCSFLFSNNETHTINMLDVGDWKTGHECTANNFTTAHTMFRRQSQARTEPLCP